MTKSIRARLAKLEAALPPKPCPFAAFVATCEAMAADERNWDRIVEAITKLRTAAERTVK